MARFLVIYHGQVGEWEKMAAQSPETAQAEMHKWMAWAERCGEGLLDMGAPLSGGLKVSSSGSSPSNKGVMGYSMLQADNMDGALALLQNHPHADWPECEIEVHECMNLPG